MHRPRVGAAKIDKGSPADLNPGLLMHQHDVPARRQGSCALRTELHIAGKIGDRDPAVCRSGMVLG